MSRSIREIAGEIRKDWYPVHPDALPYLGAMLRLESVNDTYGNDSAKSIILYFLSNTRTWRGPVARRIKAELNALVK